MPNSISLYFVERYIFSEQFWHYCYVHYIVKSISIGFLGSLQPVLLLNWFLMSYLSTKVFDFLLLKLAILLASARKRS